MHLPRLRRMYCFDCQLVVCAKCSVEGHEGHRCVDAEKAVGEFRTVISQSVARLTRLAAECEAGKINLMGKKVDFMKQVDDIELRVLRAGGDPKKIAKALRSRFASLRKKYSDDIDAEVADLDQFINTVYVFSMLCAETLNRPADDICIYGSEINNRMEEIIDMQSYHSVQNSTHTTASFKYES